LQGYRGLIRTHVLPTLGDVGLQDLRATDLDVVYAEMRGRGSALATVHHVHAVVHKMLNDAERKGIVIRNVARLANAPSLTAARSRGPEMRVWTPAELSKFLKDIAGNRNEVTFRLLALTGVRRSELCGLRWQDIDLDRHRLTVNQAVTVIDGDEHVDSPKSRRSRRVIDLDAETVALLKRHRTTQLVMYLRLGATASASDRVFTNQIGDPIRPDSIGQAFARLVKESGVPLIRLHDLRHTHASHLLLAGINIKVVSDRLGHASVGFTLDTYAHVMPGQQAEAASAAAALLH
jgi:integrase